MWLGTDLKLVNILENNQKCIHLFCSGRVQGVGFRFRVLNLAKRYSLVGWVKNLPDRRVELLIQGQTNNLDCFLADLRQEFEGNLKDYEVQEEEFSENYRDFQILF